MPINPRLHQIANEAKAAAGPGGHALFKWTCQGCKERVTFNEPNAIYTQAHHEEKLDGSPCGYVTDLNRFAVEADLGYALVLMNVPANAVGDALGEAIQRRDSTRGKN